MNIIQATKKTSAVLFKLIYQIYTEGSSVIALIYQFPVVVVVTVGLSAIVRLWHLDYRWYALHGVFLIDPNLILREFFRKLRKTPNGQVDKRYQKSNPELPVQQLWAQNRSATGGAVSSKRNSSEDDCHYTECREDHSYTTAVAFYM